MPIAAKIAGIVGFVQITKCLKICTVDCLTTNVDDDDNDNDDIHYFFSKQSAALAAD